MQPILDDVSSQYLQILSGSAFKYFLRVKLGLDDARIFEEGLNARSAPMLVVKVNDLYIVFFVDKVSLSAGQDTPCPHLVNAEGQMLAAVYPHEHNVIIPTT